MDALVTEQGGEQVGGLGVASQGGALLRLYGRRSSSCS